ncbi:hypothetical protein LguiA_008519 [Lonicera macranthoides]
MVGLSGRNALHATILNGKANVIRYMLDAKEVEGLINQADAKNKIGKTALDMNESISDRYTTFRRIRTPNVQRQLNFLRTNKEGEKSAAMKKTYRKMGHALLVVATLITKVTFAAAFTMPGGYNNNIGPEAPDQGLALLR